LVNKLSKQYICFYSVFKTWDIETKVKYGDPCITPKKIFFKTTIFFEMESKTDRFQNTESILWDSEQF